MPMYNRLLLRSKAILFSVYLLLTIEDMLQVRLYITKVRQFD